MGIDKDDTIYNFSINFTPGDIADIKHDIELSYQGYQFFYSVDTFDIFNYFLPYTDSNIFKLKNKNDVAHKVIAYADFFSSSFNKRFIILDEYKIELLEIKRFIENQMKRVSSLRINLNYLKDFSYKIFSETGKERETLRNNFELILTLLILSERKQYNKSKKGDTRKGLFNFIADKLGTNRVYTGVESMDAYIMKVFSDSEFSRNSEKIFERFVNEKAYHLLGIDSDEKRYKYLQNTYRDIEVIHRINFVNTQLLKEFANEKVIFLYLSSASFKTKEILSIMVNWPGNEISIPTVESYENFNFHRNIDQCFLFKLLMEDPTYCNKKILQLATIESLYKLTTQIHALRIHYADKGHEVELDIVDERLIKLFRKTLNNHSSNIDNHFYFKLFSDYKAKAGGSGMKNDPDLNLIIKKAEIFLDDELNSIANDLSLQESVESFLQTSLTKSVFDPSQNISFQINISFGEDIIKNSFQHFPYLVFIEENVEINLSESLYMAFDIMSEIGNAKDYKINELIPYFKSLFTQTKFQSSMEQKSFEFIITTYINLIAPPIIPSDVLTNESKLTSISEKEMHRLLSKQVRLLEHTFIHPQISTDINYDKLVFKRKEFKNLKEIYYIMLWLLRRNKDFGEGIELGEKMIKEHPTDPRFFHGLGLCYISKAYDIILKKKIYEPSTEYISTLLKHAAVNLEMAVYKYQAIQNNVISKVAKRLICKNIIAIYNSLCDITIRNHIVSSDDNILLLNKARLYLQRLKKTMNSIQLNYNNYPTFNNTEAELEYREALYYYNSGDLVAARNKLIHSLERINVFKKTKIEIDQEFYKVINEIDELRLKVL